MPLNWNANYCDKRRSYLASSRAVLRVSRLPIWLASSRIRRELPALGWLSPRPLCEFSYSSIKPSGSGMLCSSSSMWPPFVLRQVPVPHRLPVDHELASARRYVDLFGSNIQLVPDPPKKMSRVSEICCSKSRNLITPQDRHVLESNHPPLTEPAGPQTEFGLVPEHNSDPRHPGQAA